MFANSSHIIKHVHAMINVKFHHTRMHSSIIRTTRSLPYGGGGGPLSKGGLCLRGGSLSKGGLCPAGVSVGGGLCPGVSVQEGLCLGGGDLCPGRSLYGGVSVQGGLCPRGLLTEIPSSVNRITDRCKNITLPQLRCGR